MATIYDGIQGHDFVVVGPGIKKDGQETIMGIGGAVVDRLMDHDAIIHAVDNKQAVLDTLYNEIRKKHGQKTDSNLHLYKKDVTSPEYEALLREIGESAGDRIRGVVYVAGIGTPVPWDEPSREALEDTKTLYEINTIGFIRTVSALLPYFDRGSSIVSIGSINAVRPEYGMLVYDSTKAALEQATRNIACELGRIGKGRANIVAPGYIRTPQTYKELENEQTRETMRNYTLLGREGDPYEVAEAVLFLLSTSSRYITGSRVQVDGGLGLPQYPPIQKQENF